MTPEQFEKYISIKLQESKLTQKRLEENCALFVDVTKIALEIMLHAGISKLHALTAMYGPFMDSKCEGEVNFWWTGYIQMYDSCKIRYSIELARQWVNGNQWCEVGMKYPTFDKAKFVKRFKLQYVGLYPADGVEYEVWENPGRTMMWSCSPGSFGKGGYAGLVFDTFDSAYQFVQWFMSSPTHYVKDIDVFHNGLGGLGVEQYKTIRERGSVSAS